MQARFLLGPAGSGKTFRCLAEIRTALQQSPEGQPLILLAPKQATFQLERQLLADPALPGYTRLQILSFERLAQFVLAEFADAPPQLLGEEGRLMALRALLAKRQKDLRLFHATARLPGFAQQLNLALRELQRHQLSPEQLSAVAPRVAAPLDAKLHDLALLLRAYLDWLAAHGLQDAYCLLELATAELKNNPAFHFGGLWLDGFAEMTPQELDLLAALTPRCAHATLAFCLPGEPREETSWLSTWSVVSQTFRSCHQRLATLPGVESQVETLSRSPAHGRFADNPVLQHLEKNWAEPTGGIQDNVTPTPAGLNDALRVVTCANIEAEVTLAAREIRRHARGGGRYRDAAVLLRQLGGYADALRRVFTRFGIPFFLDQREPVAHHPLAELTRGALRLLAFGWQHEDWFGTLKSGLVHDDETALDRLENEALARGWQGGHWWQPIAVADDATSENWLEPLRAKLVTPFQQLSAALADGAPAGAELAAGLRELWQQLGVEQRLDDWSSAQLSAATSPLPPSPHSSIWSQMHTWLDNLALAFAQESLPLREWLPILEAGLGQLTVGVIPPALDQVLIGTIDRSRHPDLQVAFVLGMNESVFPAPPEPATLLTDADRAELEQHNVPLGPDARRQLGHERYYGYIACTRARRRLVLTCATHDTHGRTLNPSPFLAHVQRLFPQLTVETQPAHRDWTGSEHPVELIAPLLQSQSLFENRGLESRLQAADCESRLKAELQTRPDASQTNFQTSSKVSDSASPGSGLAALAALPVFAPALEKGRRLRTARQTTSLAPASVQGLYGREFATSVSALEDFAACPFRFFVARGLKAEERREFEVDPRERGSFQHEVVREFHHRVQASGRQWRDVSPAVGARLIARIGRQLLPLYRNGLFAATAASRFAAQTLVLRLQKLMTILLGWMTQYQFDPFAVEVDFGLGAQVLPAWRLPLDDEHALRLRGRIDRIDLHRAEKSDTARAVVIDYKSSVRKLDPVKLQHGLQLQLLAYLGVLRHLPDPQAFFNAARLQPAGAFYVGLTGKAESADNRTEALAEDSPANGYQHSGRFDGGQLELFDNRGVARGDQFNFAKNKDGTFHKRSKDALTEAEFLAQLDAVENQLRRIGREIFAGDVAVAPYRQGAETACDYCEYRAICRFDPWVAPYRTLKDGEAKP